MILVCVVSSFTVFNTASTFRVVPDHPLVSVHHFQERFGLLIMIYIGESLLAVILPDLELDFNHYLLVHISFMYIYFLRFEITNKCVYFIFFWIASAVTFFSFFFCVFVCFLGVFWGFFLFWFCVCVCVYVWVAKLSVSIER